MKKRINYCLIILCFGLLSINAHAQVGINTQNPFSGSEIDIQNIVLNGDTIPKGILIPRMTGNQRDKIDVSSTKEANSLLVYNIDEDCYNYYSQDKNNWVSLCGQTSKARMSPVACSDITINGVYVQGVATTSATYVSIKTTILSPGTYSISITTGNGYYFNVSGIALLKGDLVINVPAYGTPLNDGDDTMTIAGVSLADESCVPTIPVQQKLGEYALNCAKVSVYGNYYKNEQLTSNNYIDVTVTATSVGSYSISTETKNGVIFSATGIFTSLGTNVVRLYGAGTPTINSNFDINIYAYTPSGQSQCSTTIPIILAGMTYAIVGSGDYSWANVRSTVLANSSVFGVNGVVKIKGFTQLWSTTDGVSAASLITNGDANGKFPDILLYFSYGASGAGTLGPALADYIKKGGCVVYGAADNDNTNANLILSGVFGSSYANAVKMSSLTTDNGQDIYPLMNDSGNSILNGPFGNASGQYWGEDNQGSVVVSSLPPNSVQLVSAYNTGQKSSLNPTISMVWYNNSYNFIYYGDCVAASTTNTTTYWYPGYYPNYYPATKLFGSRGLSRYIYNSILELNSVAWCINKAAVNGINSY